MGNEKNSPGVSWAGMGPNGLAVTIANKLIRSFPNELEDVLFSTVETASTSVGASIGAILLSDAGVTDRAAIIWTKKAKRDQHLGQFLSALESGAPANRPSVVPDSGKHSLGELGKVATQAGIFAWISCPLVAQGTCIGRYLFCWDETVAFDADGARFARFVAQVTSSAIDRVRVSRTKARQKNLEDLLTHTSADFAYVPLSRIGRQIGVTLRSICQTLELSFGAAVVFEDLESRASKILGHWSRNDEADDFRIKYCLSPDYVGRRIQHPGPLVPAEKNRRDREKLKLGTLLQVPLVNEGRELGAVLFGCEKAVIWSSQERRVLRLVAEVIGRSWIQSRAQAELERTERAFEAIDDGLWEWLDISRTQQWWSPRMFSLLGYGSDTLPSERAVLERIHIEDRERLKTESRRCVNSGEPLHVDVRHVDGYWLRFRGRAIDSRDGRGLAGSLQDISNERNAEARLLHAQKMETVGVLAGGIAHDFNNLLTAFTNCARLAMEDVADGRGEDAQDRLSEALEVTDRAAALTRQLLTFSRRRGIHTRSIDLVDVVANILKLLQRLLPESITIVCSTSSVLPIRGDQGQLEQVIVNLCVNAGDAMPDGGALRLETSTRSVDELSAERFGLSVGEYVELAISDTGRGMPPEVVERAAEPFYTTKRQGKGTGLGLSTAYGIVDQHDGALVIESKLGAGTTVRVLIPRGSEALAEKPKVKPARSNPNGGNEHILVVEDDEMVLRTVVRILRRAGYQVSVARNGQIALELFHANPHSYHLVFLDVIMPEINGSETCRRMLEVRPNLKYLFSSGYSGGMLDESLQREETLLEKPYAAPELLERVRVLLDQQAPSL